MKKLITALTAATMLFASCKKDLEIITQPKLAYTIKCQSCTAELQLAAGIRTVNIEGLYSRVEINDAANVQIKTTGEGTIQVKVSLNDKEIYNVTNEQEQDRPIVHNIFIKK